MNLLQSVSNDLLHLFYPHTCTGCGSDVLSNDSLLCTKCFIELPVTNYAQHANNPVEKTFWGRLPLVAAHSEYYFGKDAVIQQLIHQLKYKGNKAIGFYLGELMGRSLLNSNRFNNIDGLIPLPLFPDKERKRGYNQAAIICNGMSEAMQVPVLNNVLVRQHFTETQTKKHRTERWENVSESFAINNEYLVKGKHLMLVDDVVTTGATFEAGGKMLLQIEGVRLSLAALAIATK